MGVRHSGQPLSIAATASALLSQNREWLHGTRATPVCEAIKRTSQQSVDCGDCAAVSVALASLDGVVTSCCGSSCCGAFSSSSLTSEVTWKDWCARRGYGWSHGGTAVYCTSLCRTKNSGCYLNFIISTGTMDRWFSCFFKAITTQWTYWLRFALFGPSFSGPAFSAPPRCQHFGNPKALRMLGRRRWNLTMYIPWVWGHNWKRNIEFRLLRRASHPKISPIGRDDIPRAGFIAHVQCMSYSI